MIAGDRSGRSGSTGKMVGGALAGFLAVIASTAAAESPFVGLLAALLLLALAVGRSPGRLLGLGAYLVGIGLGVLGVLLDLTSGTTPALWFALGLLLLGATLVAARLSQPRRR